MSTTESVKAQAWKKNLRSVGGRKSKNPSLDQPQEALQPTKKIYSSDLSQDESGSWRNPGVEQIGMLPPALDLARRQAKGEQRKEEVKDIFKVDENGELYAEVIGDRINLKTNELHILGVKLTPRRVKFLLASLFFSACTSLGAVGFMIWNSLS